MAINYRDKIGIYLRKLFLLLAADESISGNFLQLNAELET